MVYGTTALGDTTGITNIDEHSEMTRCTKAVVDYWMECKETIHRRFEEQCVQKIKEKAEKANAKYQAALNRKVR